MSASERKISKSAGSRLPDDSEIHFRIIDFLFVLKTLTLFIKCAVCDEKVEFKSLKKKA